MKILINSVLFLWLLAPVIAAIKVGNTSIGTYISIFPAILFSIIIIFNRSFIIDSFNKRLITIFFPVFFFINMSIFFYVNENGFRFETFTKNFLIFSVYSIFFIILSISLNNTNTINLKQIREYLKNTMLYILYFNVLFMVIELVLSVFFKYKIILPWYSPAIISPYKPSGFFAEPAHFGEFFIIYTLIFVDNKKNKIKVKEILILLGQLITGSIICFVSTIVFIFSLINIKRRKYLLILIILLFLVIYINVNYNINFKDRLSQTWNYSLALRVYKSYYVIKDIPLTKLLFGFGFAQSSLAVGYYNGEYKDIFISSGGYYSGLGNNILMIGFLGASLFEILLAYLFIKSKGIYRGIIFGLIYLALRGVADINVVMFNFWLVMCLLLVNYYSSLKNRKIDTNNN
ncbi:hypothetical protein CVT91_01185 [Candidatus Atribacteria bacterium HGW-Atribacteria-1]|nr:MAG: hypothetical protein CVT91_01185 [Candidatus Atribacteria bacterium HGW-Atribacteria-1]